MCGSGTLGIVSQHRHTSCTELGVSWLHSRTKGTEGCQLNEKDPIRFSDSPTPHLLLLNLLPYDVLERDRVRSELGDALSQLLDGHLVLVEVEAERRLVIDVALLLNVEVGGVARVELLRHVVLGVVQLLEEVWLCLESVSAHLARHAAWTYRDGQVVATGQLGDLADVPERGAHDDGLVAELLVVVEDALHALDAGVLVRRVLLLRRRLVPVEDTADEGGDEVRVGLGGGGGLDQREHEREVAVDAVLLLENLGCLDALPRGSNLDQDAVLRDAFLLVQLPAGQPSIRRPTGSGSYVDDVEGLSDGLLGVEREARVNLRRDLAWDDLQDLLAELHEQAVQGRVHLRVDVFAVVLAVLYRRVHELAILGLFRGGEDQGRVGGSILRLVLVDGREVAGVADDGLSRGRGCQQVCVRSDSSRGLDRMHLRGLRRRTQCERLTVPVALSLSRELDMMVC